jgi:hypothetical protein
MQKTMLLSILFMGMLLAFNQNVTAQNNAGNNQNSEKKVSFSFTLPAGATTSAGVFKKDGTLVRTLWSAKKFNAGTHKEKWNGKDDLGKDVFDTGYVYKVLSNNVSYNWDGVIGNSSSSFTGGGIHHGYDLIKSMAIAGNSAYVARGYDEAQGTKNKIDLSKPQEKTWILPSGQGTTQYTSHVATDGQNVYWAEWDPYNRIHYWVHATQVSDDDQYSFTGTKDIGFSPTHSIYYKSIIDLTDAENKAVTGMAVQKAGNYLFVAHGNVNKLHIFNKKTGDLVQVLQIPGARSLSVDSNDNLWIVSGTTTVARYTVNSNGSLSAATLTLNGLVDPLATQVTPDGSAIYVADGGNAMQLKAYNTTTGAISWNLGQAGGYATNATVANDKFMFDTRTYIAFERDGSFWLGDPGNWRNQHFAANRSFIENIAYLPTTYIISVDENDPTRVFAGPLEYKIDYSIKLGSNNRSWILSKNWAHNLPANNNVQESFKDVYTLSNGRTYTYIRDGIANPEIVELVAGGNLRRTGVVYNVDYSLSPDGSLTKQWKPDYALGYTVWVNIPLIGFNASNNPVWGEEYELDRSPLVGDDDPAWRGNGQEYKPREVTSTGIRMNFYGGIHFASESSFHLGGVKNGKYLWKTAKSTHRAYGGPFPANGDFDIGNGVNDFAGSNAMAIERSVFWGYHGEFWKQGQTNMWNHLYDNGLMLGQFGTSEGSYREGYPEMAGNGFSTKVVKVGDDYYLYHNDESYHSGIHRFKISGLNTIQEQTIPVQDDTTTASLTGDLHINLMTGLPFNNTLKDGTSGWNRSSKNESAYFSAATSVKTYNRDNGDDVFMTFTEGVGNTNVTRDLGKNKDVNGWKLWGDITWAGCTPNYTNGRGGVFLEVLDTDGKVITTVRYTTNYGNDVAHIMGNDVDITAGDINVLQSETAKMQALEITAADGAFTFKYGDFAPVVTSNLTDASANWQNPGTLRIKFMEDYMVHYGKIFDVANMYFSKVEESNSSEKTDRFRTIASGNWNDMIIWESSSDGAKWNAATLVPDVNANTIEIQKDHVVEISDVVTVDQLTIEKGGVLNVLPTGTIITSDGVGDDISIAKDGRLVIKSNVFGTGRIGESTGTIVGDVTVERYLPAKTFASYRMLAPSVNSTSSINDNWQEGVNNHTIVTNNDPVPGYGTHITGSLLGLNGFDATLSAKPSLFTFNQAAPNQTWDPINNTNSNLLDAKKGYLLFTKGNRSIDINDNSGASNNTTLRATGSVLTGTVSYGQLEGNGRNSVIANPYASPVSWVTLHASNSEQFENYYTLWDPNVGSKGGYVTVDVSGTSSVRTSAATTEIQSGQAFMIKTRQEVSSATFTVNEKHKSKVDNGNVFRTSGDVVAKLYASLYYVDESAKRILADGALSRFDASYTADLDGDDAGDISNFDENISFERSGTPLSIESLPLANDNDTLFLRISNMQQQAYEWQFDASDFDPGMPTRAFLVDKYLGTEFPVELEGPTVIIFAVSANPASADPNRFVIVFQKLKTLPVNMLSVKAYEQNNGVQVDWVTTAEISMDRYEVERSTDGQTFSRATAVPARGTSGTSVNNYGWFDASPVTGYNYYRIRSISKDGSSQYSKVMSVLIGKGAAAIRIFPNPVKGDNFNIQLNNLKKGIYTLRLLNMAGQTMLNRKIESNGSSSTQTINANNLSSGLYQLQVVGDDFKQSQQLIKL